MLRGLLLAVLFSFSLVAKDFAIGLVSGSMMEGVTLYPNAGPTNIPKGRECIVYLNDGSSYPAKYISMDKLGVLEVEVNGKSTEISKKDLKLLYFPKQVANSESTTTPVFSATKEETTTSTTTANTATKEETTTSTTTANTGTKEGTATSNTTANTGTKEGTATSNTTANTGTKEGTATSNTTANTGTKEGTKTSNTTASTGTKEETTTTFSSAITGNREDTTAKPSSSEGNTVAKATTNPTTTAKTSASSTDDFWKGMTLEQAKKMEIEKGSDCKVYLKNGEVFPAKFISLEKFGVLQVEVNGVTKEIPKNELSAVYFPKFEMNLKNLR
jgi:hypothetical protein